LWKNLVNSRRLPDFEAGGVSGIRSRFALKGWSELFSDKVSKVDAFQRGLIRSKIILACITEGCVKE